MDSIVIYTDGSFNPNSKIGGWGALIKASKQLRTILGGERESDNNRMELAAVVMALTDIAKSNKPCRVHFYVDSLYVLRGIKKQLPVWKAAGLLEAGTSKLKDLDLWLQLIPLLENKTFQLVWNWVRSHSGNKGNNAADKLAKEGVVLAARKKSKTAGPYEIIDKQVRKIKAAVLNNNTDSLASA